MNAPAHVSASTRPGASPLPPAEPAPAAEAAVAPDSDPLHTSAPAPAQAITGVAAAGGRIRRRIAFRAPLDVATLWDSALRACRAAAGRHLDDWECFLVLVRALRDTWENPEGPHWRRRYRIFERDGWRCMAPGCSSRSGLNEHHIIFRSHQGDDDEENLVALCIGRHQQGIHGGRIRCIGRAPGALWWDLGSRPGGEPLIRYFGERVVTRLPLDPSRPGVRPAPLTLAVAR